MTDTEPAGDSSPPESRAEALAELDELIAQAQDLMADDEA